MNYFKQFLAHQRCDVCLTFSICKDPVEEGELFPVIEHADAIEVLFAARDAKLLVPITVKDCQNEKLGVLDAMQVAFANRAEATRQNSYVTRTLQAYAIYQTVRECVKSLADVYRDVNGKPVYLNTDEAKVIHWTGVRLEKIGMAKNAILELVGTAKGKSEKTRGALSYINEDMKDFLVDVAAFEDEVQQEVFQKVCVQACLTHSPTPADAPVYKKKAHLFMSPSRREALHSLRYQTPSSFSSVATGMGSTRTLHTRETGSHEVHPGHLGDA